MELYHSIQFKRCARSTAFHGEPKGALPFNSEGVPGARPSMESPRELCHSIQKVCQEHGLPSMMIIMEFRKTHLAWLYICTCVFLVYDIIEYVYHSACDNKFSVQLDAYFVQRKYILRIYVSKSITTQSSSPYKVVLVSTSMVIVILLLIQHVGL